MDIRDIIKPDITGLAKRAKFRPKLVPSIYSKHPNPSPPCTEPFDRAKFGSRFIQVIHRAAASIQHHLLSPPLLELDIRNSPPLPAFPRHLIVALWIAKFTRFAFAPVGDNKLSRERKREAKEVWRRKGRPRSHRPLKPASICRDRKLDDRNLIVAFRTPSHRIGNILCVALVGGWLIVIR